MLPGRSTNSTEWSAPTRGIGRLRKQDELVALEPTDLLVDNAGSCHSSAVKARPEPFRSRGGCFAARRPDLAPPTGAGYHAASAGAFSSAG